jgi:hypothetical protein
LLNHIKSKGNSITLAKIQLPPSFKARHEQAVIDYLADRLRGREAWRLAFEAFDLLDHAVLTTLDGRHSFRALYLEVVDNKIADSYIQALLALHDVVKESPALWSGYARQITAECQRRGWRAPDLPGARILLGYLQYWWGSFARGYAFEVEIFRDLQRSSIEFQAHDLLDRRARYSLSDLIVSNMAGDIKTSVYFVQVAAPLQHDFYVVRLFVQGRHHTLAVMLQPLAWDEINGDMVDGTLDTVVIQFPYPIRIRQGRHELVAIEYTEWKKRILRLQGKAE